MLPGTNTRRRLCRFILASVMATLMGSGFVAALLAQAQPAPKAAEGLPPELSQVPQKKPRPDKGPESVPAFIDHVTSNDAAFEVILGQGRILALKSDLSVAGKPAPLIAVGDPALIEFTMINPSQMRVIGLKIGVTDLSITISDGKTYSTYSLEVHVTADLNPLRGQLHRSFPDATVKLSQLRDHVVVEGQARDSAQAAKIIETVTAYMESITLSQDRKITTTGQKAPEPKADGKKELEQVPAPVGPLAPGFKVESKLAQPKIINLLRVPDPLVMVQGQLARSFPDASLRLTRVGNQVMVEGQARDSAQVAKIIQSIQAYVDLMDEIHEGKADTAVLRKDGTLAGAKKTSQANGGSGGSNQPAVNVGGAGAQDKLKIINRLRVPGPQQVLLKVRIAELNRTAFRQIGADFLAASPNNGALIGTTIGANSRGASVHATSAGLTGLADLFGGGPATMFGVFENSDFSLFVNALRRNELLKILAEPNLVALNGQQATFLAGGEFPVPVPQAGATGAATITIEFKKFGIQLKFKPDILDGGNVRLAVDPEVSSIDFSIGTSINGTVVPGLNTRNAHTVVEMKEGQTLAMAGLLSVTLEGTTNRIPGLGDVPILGPFFSNTTSKRQEKELIVLVTPYLVDAVSCDQVPPVPGAEVNGPNDLEFYLGNRIEGKSGRDWRATTGRYTAAPAPVPAFLRLHNEYIRGPHGFSD